MNTRVAYILASSAIMIAWFAGFVLLAALDVLSAWWLVFPIAITFAHKVVIDDQTKKADDKT